MLERKKILSLIITLIFITGFTLGNISPAAAMVGEVWFDRDYYSLGQAEIQVHETSGLSSVTVTVTSNSDGKGIQVNLTESQQDKGIYTGIIILTTENSDDTQDRLKVSNGDTITAHYGTNSDTATIDTTPPQAISFTPADGAKGISTDTAQISVEFSEPIDPNSGSGISIVDGNNNPVNIKTRSVTGNTLNIELYYSLSYQETYTVTIPAGSVVDLAGNGCSEVSWSFSTIEMELDSSVYKSHDTVTVTLYDSAKESGSVTVMAKCENYSSDPINVVSLPGSGGKFTASFTLSSPGGNSDDNNEILGVGSYGYFTVYYDPDNDGTYEVFASAYVDNEAPIVSATSPQDGAGDVAVDAPITITFSEPVQEGDQLNLIEIKDNAGNPVGGTSCIIEGSTLTINHDAFEHSTQYTLYLPTDAVRDAVGNMYNTTNFELMNFTTAAIPPAEIHVDDDNGSDTVGDGSQSNPYRTITKALQVANDGDTIVVHDGTYNESVVVTKDVTITSLNGPEVTSIQPAAGDGFAIQPASGSYRARRITGFTISGANHGISVSGMSGGEVYLENNIISGCGDGIYIEDHSGGTVYVQKNTITGNTDAGIRLGTSADGDWVEVKWNNIVNNGSGIVHNGTNQLDAPLNFWGNPHGPTHDGINYGDAISGNIDFQPWLVNEFTGEEVTTELSITSPTLAEGYLGLEYFAELPWQSDAGSVQWSPYSSSLPGGINIVSGRELYGHPSAVGSYSFALEASDGTQAVYKDVSLNVASDYTGSGPAVITRSPAPYETGVAVDEPIIIVFNEPVRLIDSYQGYITITNEEDPDDVVATEVNLQTTSVSDDTLVITHENLRPDTLYKVSIAENAVTDAGGNGFTTTWYFTTGSESIPLEITTSTLPEAAVGENYNAQLEASGGSGSYRWSIVSGSLPAGLELDSRPGIISGIPTQGGTFDFTVKVTDELNNTAEKALTVTVEVPDTAPPEVFYKIPDHGETGVPQNITITVKFDEPIQQGNSFDSISISGNISFSITIEGDVLKLNPTTDLNANTWYNVTIPAGAVRDTAGNETPEPDISFSFKTGEAQDIHAPQVSITTPADDGGIFSNRLTVTGSVYEESLKLVEVSLFSVGQNTYWNGSAGSWVADKIWNSTSFSRLAPNYDFQYVTPVLLDGEYLLSVRALDYAGNSSEEKTVSFEIDSTPPVVVNTVPPAGAWNVPLDQPITVTFSENVVPGDLTLLTLKDANTQMVVPIQASLDEQTGILIITHSDLEYDTVYELFIDEGIVEDLAGNNNVEKFITFKTAEGDGTTGDIPSEPPTTTVQVIFEDGDADGVYYYRPNGESDTLSFSLSGLPAGYNLKAEFGALDAGGSFTVTDAVYNEPVGGDEIEPGVYFFSVDIANSNNNNYLPVAVRLSGLPAADIPPFVLTDTSAGPGEVRLAFVNLYPPQPEEAGLTLVVEPQLDSFDNLRAVPGVKFTLQEDDGTKIGSIEIGSDTNPLDFLATDENGEPQLAKLQQAMKISADYDYNQLAAGIDTDVLSFLADKDATIRFYNVSEVLGVQLTPDNFRQMISLEVLDNDGNAVSDIAEYVNVSSMNYVPADGETPDMLIIPVNHFTTYKITPVEDYGEEAPVHYDDEDDDKDRETDRYTTEKAAEEAEKVEDIVNNPDAAENEIGEAAVNVSYSLLKAAEKVKSEEDARKLAEAASRTAKSLRKAAERIQEEETAVNTVKEMIEGVGGLYKALDDNIEKDGSRTKTLLADKIINAAERAIQKAATSELQKDGLNIEQEKATAKADAASLQAAAKTAVENAREIADKLRENEIEPNRSIKPVVLINVPTVEGIREVEVDLPAEAVDAVREAGVDALEVRTEFADFKVNPESLDKDGINGKTSIISFRARKIDRMQIPETLRNSIPESSIVVNLDAAAGGQKIRQFNKPVEAAIPYKLGNKK